MKYTFVGDVHGKVGAVKEALSRDGMKIFVGDFIDSFDRSSLEHKECYELVCAAIEAGEARAIFGNHELSYLMPKQHRCSGYDDKRAQVMLEYAPQIEALFEPYIFLGEGTVLVTHAGLTRQLWDKEKLTLETLPETLSIWWKDPKSPAHWIGHYRGGMAPYGGIFWCDFNQEFQPVPEISQIFGHTRGNGIRSDENSFCIDCLDGETSFLELDLDE